MSENLVDYEDAITRYDPVIGLEVHVELGTRTKIFDGAPNVFGAEPNTAVTPISLGLPGTLPVANKAVVESAIRLGLALGCTIAPSTRFARKNYFYPDLTKNFQTSQSDEPIAYDGALEVTLADGQNFTVQIERAHMEEDAGKSSHVSTSGRIHGAEYSLVDYNRAGVPLVEIVSRPITGAGESAPALAAAYVRTLRDLFRALGISEARMERGNVRADVNVSLRPSPDAPLGTRTETKNVNSFRSVEAAVRYEIQRQAAVLDAGLPVVQETRHWHEEEGTTSSGRPKSDADDYRYFPEPDLVPIVPDPAWVEQLRAQLPELPAVRKRRLQGEWGVDDREMTAMVNLGALDLIEQTVQAGAPAPAARKWWTGELARLAGVQGVDLDALTVTPAQVAEVQAMIDQGKLTDKLARQVIEGVLAGEGTPQEVVGARGLEVVSDSGELEAAVDEALAAMPDVVEKIRSGKVQAAGAVVGAVMKATRGKADAAAVREIVMRKAQG